MNNFLYPARIWKEDNVYYVQFKDLQNGFTFGETLEQAKEMATDVLSSLLASYLEHNEPLPARITKMNKTKDKDIYWITPDAKVQAAILLRTARASISQSKIAENMGTTWQAYQKIESPRSNTTLNKLQKAAKALNKRLVIEFLDNPQKAHS